MLYLYLIISVYYIHIYAPMDYSSLLYISLSLYLPISVGSKAVTIEDVLAGPDIAIMDAIQKGIDRYGNPQRKKTQEFFFKCQIYQLQAMLCYARFY